MKFSLIHLKFCNQQEAKLLLLQYIPKKLSLFYQGYLVITLLHGKVLNGISVCPSNIIKDFKAIQRQT